MYATSSTTSSAVMLDSSGKVIEGSELLRPMQIGTTMRDSFIYVLDLCPQYVHLELSAKTANSHVHVKTVQVVTLLMAHVHAQLDSKMPTAAQVSGRIDLNTSSRLILFWPLLQRF